MFMQTETKLYIKGMVCERCILVIRDELQALGHNPVKISLGEVTFLVYGRPINVSLIKERLTILGFKLLEDQKVKIVDDVKKLVAEVYSGAYDFPLNFRFSALLKERLQKDYDTLSNLFTLLEQRTLEQYIIDYRIEKVKELLVYSNDTLSGIAFKLNYSSLPHLSKQFKQYTGLNPSYFREVKKSKHDMVSPLI
jgi:AraC family transcriptional regulator